MGLNNGAGSGHSEGAIKLLKARGPPNPDDMFETELVMCVRAPAVFLFPDPSAASADDLRSNSKASSMKKSR